MLPVAMLADRDQAFRPDLDVGAGDDHLGDGFAHAGSLLGGAGGHGGRRWSWERSADDEAVGRLPAVDADAGDGAAARADDRLDVLEVDVVGEPPVPGARRDRGHEVDRTEADRLDGPQPGRRGTRVGASAASTARLRSSTPLTESAYTSTASWLRNRSTVSSQVPTKSLELHRPGVRQRAREARACRRRDRAAPRSGRAAPRPA